MSNSRGSVLARGWGEVGESSQNSQKGGGCIWDTSKSKMELFVSLVNGFFRELTVSTDFRANLPKIYGNCLLTEKAVK